MSIKRIKRLWWFTGLLALILLLVTVALFVRAGQVEDKGILAYVAGSSAAPFLRTQPGNDGAILMVLEVGSPVRITDSATRNNQNWYHVNIGERSGWLLASLITLDSPQTAPQQ